MGADAEVKPHGFQGRYPPIGVFQASILTHLKEAPVLFIPDPGVFHETDTMVFQLPDDIFSDLLPSFKIQIPIGGALNQNVIHATYSWTEIQ